MDILSALKSVSMIEPWLLCAITSMIIGGIPAFLSKVTAERGYDSTFLSIYIFLWQLLVSILLYIPFGTHAFSWLGVLIPTGAALVAWGNYKYRADALVHMDSSMFFMNYRVLSSLMLMGIGVLGFKEQITVMNLIGIFLGFWVFYLLTEKPHWGIKREFIKGIPFLLITATCVSLLNAFQKLLPYANVNVFDYLFIASVAGMIFSLWMNWKAIQKGQLLKNSNNIVGMGLLQGFLLGILTVVSGSSYMFWGELVIVYKITSYSIFIPIVLSMIVYKEKITIRKAFAAVLMAISLYFLV